MRQAFLLSTLIHLLVIFCLLLQGASRSERSQAVPALLPWIGLWDAPREFPLKQTKKTHPARRVPKKEPPLADSLTSKPPSPELEAQAEPSSGNVRTESEEFSFSSDQWEEVHRIQSQINAVLVYPRSLMKKGLTGTTRVFFELGADGEALQCRVHQSSGSDELDQLACDAVTKAAPFQGISSLLQRKKRTFLLPIEFQGVKNESDLNR
ncbi:MAG: energy transducer TonB [Bdellovibrionia bacterium]